MTALNTPTNGFKEAVSPAGQSPKLDMLAVTSPATGRHLTDVPLTPLADAPRIMETARQAQKTWFRMGLKRRIAIVAEARANMQRHLDDFVAAMVAEQGKPAFEALCEFWASIEPISYYLRNVGQTLRPRNEFVALLPHRIHWIERRPHGVVLVISPWNFPLLLPVGPTVAALLAGNAVVFKPSEFTPLTGELLRKCFIEAGVPEGVFQIAHGRGDLGAALIDAKPNKISFTGSVPTGRKIAARAGELLIPVQLELGAKDAAIILDDADLERAGLGVTWGSLFNSGQACVSVERIYAHRSIMDALIQKITRTMDSCVVVGPGEAPGVTLGTICTTPQLKVIESHLEEARTAGAKIVFGGRSLDESKPHYFRPALVTDFPTDLRLWREETFGPIIAVIPFDRDEEAVELANASPYGLTGSVWTRNRARGLYLASRLEVGHAAVNDHVVSSQAPNLPWGGTKDSGYGSARGKEALLEMTRPQSFSVERFGSLPAEPFWYPYTPLKFKALRWFIRLLYAGTWRERIAALFGR